MKLVAFFILSLVPQVILAQPNFNTKLVMEGVILFQDTLDPELYWYLDKDLTLETNNFGKPNLKFDRATYTGQRRFGDSGLLFNFHQLSFSVVNLTYQSNSLDTLKRILGEGSEIELRKLPLKKIEAVLSVPLKLGANRFIDGGVLKVRKESSIWERRQFTITLNLQDGKLLWDILGDGNTAIDVVYSYYADVSNANDISQSLVHSNAFSIQIDTVKHKGLMETVDLNSPGLITQYPILNIIYEGLFVDADDNLYERIIEIEAKGFTAPYREYVTAKCIFSSEEPAITHRPVYFEQPVRTDKPFRIRITDVLHSGAVIQSEWMIIRDWGVLDISRYFQR